MLSLAKGSDVGYLTKEVAGGREGYYTGAAAAGEPAGLWYGAGAEALGLSGEIDADLMEAIYAHLLDPRDPAAHDRETWGEAGALAPAHRAYRSADDIYAGLLEKHAGAGPEERAELRAQADRSARSAVAFVDATFSAPKSVSVLGVAFERAANDARLAGDTRAAAAWDAHAQAVEDAVMAGARAAIDHLQDVAGYSRVGHHGGGSARWIDAHEWIVGQFLQHDSRDRDPQLHVHQAVLNRALCADGVWRALDGQAIITARPAAGAIAERVMEAYLTATLGIEFAARTDGHGREVLGVPAEVVELFSSRRHALTEKAQELVAEFTARTGREPAPIERTRLAQQATLATRPGKSHYGETDNARSARWDAETRALVADGLGSVAAAVLDRAQQAGAGEMWSPTDVIERALAATAATRQTWAAAELTREISDALPANLDIGPDDVRELLLGLTDAAVAQAVRISAVEDTRNLPAEFRLADGSSAFARPGAVRYATDGQIAADRVLRAAAVTRGAVAWTAKDADGVVARFAESGRALGVDQAAALHGILTSGARLEVMSAAAGTGKSFTVAALAQAWAVDGRRVVGLAPSQVAADVLTADGVPAQNTTRWLRGPDGHALRAGDLVVVDEAGMASTDQLAEIQHRCARADAKLLLVGDPRQLAAVGPGGALADVAEHGLRYELTEVRRFTADWERTASLGLREGDPTVLDDYAKHGRLVAGGTVDQAERAAGRAWLADTLAGRESVLLVGSNEAAGRLSAALRAELVALGRVEERGVLLGRQGTVAGVGDVVQARHNGWELIGFDGNDRAPINRTSYTVTGLREDGGLTVAPTGDPAAVVQLPVDYVAEHLTLDYASTVHAAQGRTVDTTHSVVGAGTDAAALYVGMTRGRDNNIAWTVTRATAPDAATGEALDAPQRSARAVLQDVLDVDRADVSALTEQRQSDLLADSTLTHLDRLIAGAEIVTERRTATALDRLVTDGRLSEADRTALAADTATGSLNMLLRTAELAGHDPKAVLSAAVGDRDLADARSPAQVLHHRITSTLHGQLTPQIHGAADLIPRDAPPDWLEWFSDRAEQADARRLELGAQVANDPAEWAREALGAVPDDVLDRADWEDRAGWAASWRELAGHDDDTDALGAAPPRGLVDKAALFRAGHTALGLLDAGAEEANLSDGQLRARVVAQAREEKWAPRFVADELDATHRQIADREADATIWAEHADAAGGLVDHKGSITDSGDGDRLRDDAAAAAAESRELAGRAAQLEAADQARAVWLAETAVTRENAHRSRAELNARGIDLDDTSDHVTTAEWIAAGRAEQADDERTRPVREEHELVDHDTDLDRTDLDAVLVDEQAPETDVADIRDTATPDATETTDPTQRQRVPTTDETREAVERAQDALREVAQRKEADQARAAHDDVDRARRTVAVNDQTDDEALVDA